MDAKTQEESIGMTDQERGMFNVLGDRIIELVNGFPPFPVCCALIETLSICVMASNPEPDQARSAMERLIIGVRESLEAQIKEAADKAAEVEGNDDGR